jgi:hypothetical protein
MLRLLTRAACIVVFMTGVAGAAPLQDKYDLPEPYLSLEKSYLAAYPALQDLMDGMIANSVAMLKDPDQDILHNRVCAALAYKMAVDRKLPDSVRKLAPATDILHNITKDDKSAMLTDPAVLKRVADMVAGLKKAGKFTASPKFFSDETILASKAVGGNLALVHHLAGALNATDILRKSGKFSEAEITEVQTAVIAHSTGYWYFRDSVDDAAKKAGAWESVFPQPESDMDKFAHDADLISQFVPESVAPEGSKWRELAVKRWGAKSTKDEGHVVYYVFSRLFDEAKTEQGRAMALEQWAIIQPDLLKLMGLEKGQDPLKILGVPAFWSKKP